MGRFKLKRRFRKLRAALRGSPPDDAGVTTETVVVPPDSRREMARRAARRTRRFVRRSLVGLIVGLIAGWLAGAYITFFESYSITGLGGIPEYLSAYAVIVATALVGLALLFPRRTRLAGLVLLITAAGSLLGLASWMGRLVA